MRMLGVLIGVIIATLLFAVTALGDSAERDIMIDNFDASSKVNWDYVSDQVMGVFLKVRRDWQPIVKRVILMPIWWEM